MQVKLDPLYVWLDEYASPTAFYLSYHTGRSKDEAMFKPTSDDEMNAKCRAVIDYLSHSAEWVLGDED
ncbi:hypothetical protein CLAFUW4_05199 [Fulvia fulva]|uniref:Uncharacterized protein n=1 Tax=Passalora fulva TaxID=5499 RepID=A0A9Q8PIY4_PASFU|nr:uncharacterized protein CLAFUR5_11707 [Fulvia fulva]KAK4626539.1 hypothetical protein CLAFUR4_05185 [Fulvia fulva]KAK4628151.1 hypothetical protein CLAFUR0_05191 [Fulvia fulva]UJO23272.1 hypothetical protein CLAFUR5_11707 [Fulvia fulva]WPV13330.1 hypothetical protein CLAFUW4_05199 [Fulvia fulva]WPV29184.1 hypothetical protein CLAFUW7_05195 [Fulvia fulva]